MPIHIFWPNQELLQTEGYGRVAHVPCFFNHAWTYEREPSTYLIDRALVNWWPTAPRAFGAPRVPTRASLKAFAESISNFLEWTEFRVLDWKTVRYSEHLLDGYQADMLAGNWSANGQPLSPRTVNLRVQEACNFLTWAAERGLRSDFVILTSSSSISSRDFHSPSRSGISASRLGKVRTAVEVLRLPTDDEVKRWLRTMAAERGSTKALMAELILKTAVRREEAASWRVDTLPSLRNEWHVLGDQVKVTIMYGTKGTGFGQNAGDKIGPARDIWIPLELANRLDEYRSGKRLVARAKWVRSASTAAEKRTRIQQTSPHLFLSEFTGTRVSSKSLYEAWTNVSYTPFKGWSPHGGRRFWACKTLLLGLQKRRSLIDRAGALPLDWIVGNAMTDIQLIIKPQLGHLDQRTTERYLQWVARIYIGDDVQLQYVAKLDGLAGADIRIDEVT